MTQQEEIYQLKESRDFWRDTAQRTAEQAAKMLEALATLRAEIRHLRGEEHSA